MNLIKMTRSIIRSIVFLTLTLICSCVGTIYMVGGNNGQVDGVKLTMSNPASDETLPDFPNTISHAVGGFFQNEVLVCGGFKYPVKYYKDCYSLKPSGNVWESRPSLNYYRKGGASIVIDENTFWVTGGESYEGCSKATEILKSDSSEWILGPDLPECLVEHCMVKLDNDTILITGGRQVSFHPYASQRTWLYFIGNSTFLELENSHLSDKRIGHSCAPFILSDGSVVATTVGGKSSDIYPQQTSHTLTHMEIFHPDTQRWTLMNQPVPILHEMVFWGASLVPSENGLLLLGGTTATMGPMDSIYEYQEKYGFRVLNHHLRKGRFGDVTVSTDRQIWNNETTSSDDDLNFVPDLLVIGGRNFNPTSEVELISFNNETQVVQVPNFPHALTGAVGVWFSGRPMVCGGMAHHLRSNECFSLESNLSTWTNGPPMKSHRYRARGLTSQKELWILGGEDSFVTSDTTEVLKSDSNEWIEYHNSMPRSLTRHCMVKLNDTHVLMAGGKQWENDGNSDLRSRRVWIGTWLTGEWTEMDPMNVPRYDHACGRFTLKSGAEIVVVAGGKTGLNEVSNIRQIEWFHLDTYTWTLMNQTLIGHPELGLFSSSLAETESQLILLGGTDGFNYYDNIYAYHEDFGFYDIGKKLKSPKCDATVIPIEKSN